MFLLCFLQHNPVCSSVLYICITADFFLLASISLHILTIEPTCARLKDFGPEWIDRITGTLERFSTKALESERQLRAEMETKLAEQLARKERSMEEHERAGRLKYETELHDLKVYRSSSDPSYLRL